MAAEVPLPSTSPGHLSSVPRAHQTWLPGFVPSGLGVPVLASGFVPVRTRPGRPASVSPASCRPASVSHARPRAHQAPFCARGLQKIIAVSENAPGAHGIVPRHCSTRAAGMNAVPPQSILRRETSTAKPLPRSSPYGTVPAATRKRQIQPQPPLPRSPRRAASTSTRRAAGPDRRAAPRDPQPCP